MFKAVGIVVSSEKIIAITAEIPKAGNIQILGDHTWSLQKGARSQAYHVMHQQICNYVRENKVDKVLVKESAVSLGGTKKAHLEAAELRGVVISAAAGVTSAETLSKAHMSRTFGNRKVDEYLKDNSFWDDNMDGELRSGSREAAMLLIAKYRKANA